MKLKNKSKNIAIKNIKNTKHNNLKLDDSKLTNIPKIKTPKKPKFIDDTNECRICCEEFSPDNDKEFLRCGHSFHYDCIIYAFQAPTTLRTCPYCRKYHGYLRLKEDMVPIILIHKEANIVKTTTLIIDKCQALYKSGLKAGTQCINKKKENNQYCGIHKNITP